MTPAADVSSWTHITMEQHQIQKKLMEMDVVIIPHRNVTAVRKNSLTAACVYTDITTEYEFDSLVMVTSRRPNNDLYLDLKDKESDWADAGIQSVRVIGDANAPATIAYATFAGRRYAEELDAPDIGDDFPFKREVTALP